MPQIAGAPASPAPTVPGTMSGPAFAGMTITVIATQREMD